MEESGLQLSRKSGTSLHLYLCTRVLQYKIFIQALRVFRYKMQTFLRLSEYDEVSRVNICYLFCDINEANPGILRTRYITTLFKLVT
jgi:hypothetical protein